MNIVGYVRLSRDEDKENYSSIDSQKAIIKEYAANKGWTINKFYIDDNYTGYTFDRPEFKEMKEQLKSNNIDIIIAKDLSRIGRHNAKVQLFIELVQKLGKRILLPEEGRGYDSDVGDDILGIKTWYNEMYVKDISRKIRSSMSTKQKNGELIMGNFYGYKKLKVNDKFQLTPDEDIIPIIKLIFKLYISGKGYKRICDILNEKKCITPSEYIKKRHENKGRVFKNKVTNIWQTHMIQRIISDDIYIGVLRTNKKHSKMIKGKQEKVPKDKQFTFGKHHKAIISDTTFELAQRIKAKKSKRTCRVRSNYHNYIFSGFIKCGDCGHAVLGKKIRRKNKIEFGYECSFYQKYGLKQCKSHAVTEDKILFAFKEFLKDVKIQYADFIKSINVKQNKINTKTTLHRIKKELDISNQELKMLISQKIKDLIKETNLEYKKIIENNYNELEKEKKEKINSLTKEIGKLEKIKNTDIEKNIRNTMDIFDKIIKKDRPDHKLLELILDNIILYKDRTLEFNLLVDIDKLTYVDI
ncbi:recombinase family protein [Clostridium tyrobutyricum]|uniref:recombinase family protein n=1 Tax=Clostridium tyrobutyricum TaxID=1519 RepID=UPI001C3892AE|nr:recombinase family protein [Clostridium tyrobutyricum]MBV4427592.1 recombinase family protein [Clostridium tyrobutyricum]MBV4442671.1 recombinase family protein [Clostridium tyrobutyricum]MBV4450111.1 recombinase family protein [Clostridium tyrobutyricum]